MFNFDLISYWPWITGCLGLFGLAFALSVRLIQKAGLLDTAVGTIESTCYSTLGSFGGIVASLFFSQILASEVISFISMALAVMCIVGIILGFIHGNASAGPKTLGTITYLALAGLFTFASIQTWGSQRSPEFVGGLSIVFALNGAAMGISFALYRSAHWSIGWLLAFINGSWGVLGTFTGMLLHVGTWTFFSKTTASPGRGTATVLSGSQRKFFHCWKNGMRIMDNYFFSQGPTMTAWSSHGMWHEAVHVVQHYIFGPLMLISYVTWAGLMGFIGAIVGLTTGNGIAHGAFAWAYVNNPWEVWEYNSSWGSSSASTRAVSGNVVKAGKSSTDLVFGNTLAWPLTIIWIALWVVGFVTLTLLSTE